MRERRQLRRGIYLLPTLFQFGSTGKTYTATAMMRLAEQGKVDLDAPVSTYLPELALKASLGD